MCCVSRHLELSYKIKIFDPRLVFPRVRAGGEDAEAGCRELLGRVDRVYRALCEADTGTARLGLPPHYRFNEDVSDLNMTYNI